MSYLHFAPWWRRYWERSGILDVELADTLHDEWRVWLEWQRMACPDNRVEIEAVEADCDRYLGYVRVVGRRPLVSLPVEYTKKPLLRS